MKNEPKGGLFDFVVLGSAEVEEVVEFDDDG